MSSLEAPKLYESATDAETLRSAFLNGQLPVAVYGLGKMGLPLAGVYGETCGNVIGADVDPDVVETVNRGECHVKREPGLNELVSELVAEDSFKATSDPLKAANEARIHVVIVPTPITDSNEPDLSILEAAVETIGRGLNNGDMVIVECTVPPRTTEEVVVGILDKMSDLDVDDYGVAFCPERTSSGRALKDIRGAYPKVVGGVDKKSTRIAEMIYNEINDRGVIPVSDATTAEAVKVFEGLYRDVNIALANELGKLTDELSINVNEAIEVANTQPFCEIHDPGPGVGGHCIPFYPYFIIDPFETRTPLLETAREVNDSMPQFTVEKVQEEFDAEGVAMTDTSALVLGLTYRPGVEEIRASPSLAIAEQLSERGADVYGVDPMLDDFEEFDLQPMELTGIYNQSFDTVIMVTPHEEFDSINWSGITREDGQLVVIDGRDTLEISETDHRVYTIGGGKNV